MIALAHDLEMDVVGKSVEFDTVLQRLAAWSCDYAQGYLLCRPMQAAEFMAWCQKHYGQPI
jgi:EAL domain-containing protein (putative c-di-GMP-specific phosphodiesterase class I)